MAKKKHAEHVNHERWLVSYADFITLLFAFFVVLFSSGQADKKKQQKFASAFQHAFSQMALFDPASKNPAPNDSAGANPDAEPRPLELPIEASDAVSGKMSAETAHQVAEKLAKIVQQKQKAGELGKADVELRRTQEGFTLSLHEGAFFDSGSAELRSDAVTTLLGIAASLPDAEIRVEGHTDNLPIHSATYASNWELSTARAAAIGRFLLEHSHLNPGHLAVAGYAEFHPVASNATAEGRAKNRRVDIVFLTAPAEDKQPAATSKTPLVEPRH